MPVFRYEAVNDQGRTISGTMAAENELQLGKKLKSAKLWVTEAAVEVRLVGKNADASASGSGLPLWGKKRRRALIDFCTMMGFQTKVGVPLVQALEVAGQQYENVKFRTVVAGVQQHMEAGLRFHEALARYPRIFSTEFLGVVRAGESSGNLPETFRDLKKYLEWVDRVIGEVRQATLYPMIVLSIISTFVLLLFTFIIPKFQVLLSRLHVEQPLLTQGVFALSEFAKTTWWIWLLLLLFFTVGLQTGRRFSKRFAWHVDRAKLRIPVFGELNQMMAISRFANNFVVLYRAGIPVLSALELCEGLVCNAFVADALAAMQEDLKSGSTISEAMRHRNIFPPMMLRMAVVGESIGNIDAAMGDVAEYYSEIIPARIKKILILLEPALMLSLIFVVLIVALAIYMPLISLMGNIR